MWLSTLRLMQNHNIQTRLKINVAVKIELENNR